LLCFDFFKPLSLLCVVAYMHLENIADSCLIVSDTSLLTLFSKPGKPSPLSVLCYTQTRVTSVAGSCLQTITLSAHNSGAFELTILQTKMKEEW
jgi:hypothetical protein